MGCATMVEIYLIGDKHDDNDDDDDKSRSFSDLILYVAETSNKEVLFNGQLIFSQSALDFFMDYLFQALVSCEQVNQRVEK